MARGKGLYRRGRIWWLMYAGLDGKVRFESSKTSDYREAEAKLIDRRKGIQEGKEPSTVKIRNHTFADLAVQYLLWATRQRAYRRKQIIVKQLVSEFGNLPLRPSAAPTRCFPFSAVHFTDFARARYASRPSRHAARVG